MTALIYSGEMLVASVLAIVLHFSVQCEFRRDALRRRRRPPKKILRRFSLVNFALQLTQRTFEPGFGLG
jgi:hypothetical protein